VDCFVFALQGLDESIEADQETRLTEVLAGESIE